MNLLTICKRSTCFYRMNYQSTTTIASVTCRLVRSSFLRLVWLLRGVFFFPAVFSCPPGVAGLLQQPPAQAGVGQAAAREDGERDGALLGLPAVPSRAAEEDRREDGAEGGARTQPRVSHFALPHPRGRSLFRGSSTTTTCTAYGFIFSRGRAHHFHHHHTSHHRQQHSRYQS